VKSGNASTGAEIKACFKWSKDCCSSGVHTNGVFFFSKSVSGLFSMP
jgi:hypothetical protein